MNHRKTAEELQEHAALAVATVRTDIHNAFRKGASKGFSRDHIREALVQRGYRSNDLAYVEQLLDGPAKDPERKVTVRVHPTVYLAIAVLVIMAISWGVFLVIQRTNAHTQENTDAVRQAISHIQEQQQNVLTIAQQLQVYPSLGANLAETDRNALLMGHVQALQSAAVIIDQQLVILNNQETN